MVYGTNSMIHLVLMHGELRNIQFTILVSANQIPEPSWDPNWHGGCAKGVWCWIPENCLRRSLSGQGIERWRQVASRRFEAFGPLSGADKDHVLGA